MLDVKKTITKLLGSVVQLTTEQKTFSFGAAKNNVDYGLVQNVAKSGWTPLGVVGWHMGGTYYTWFHISQCFLSGNNLQVNVRANSPTAFTSNGLIVYIDVLYIKVGGVLLNSIFKAFSHLQIGGGIDESRPKETVGEHPHKSWSNRKRIYGFVDSIVLIISKYAFHKHYKSAKGHIYSDSYDTNTNYNGTNVACPRGWPSVLFPWLATSGNADSGSDRTSIYMGAISCKQCGNILIFGKRGVKSSTNRINTPERGCVA